MAETSDQDLTFGEWLLAQSLDGPIAVLVQAAKADTLFPSRANPDQMRLHIAAMGGDGEWFAVVDEAETEWMGY